jgi:hypothetical protein
MGLIAIAAAAAMLAQAAPTAPQATTTHDPAALIAHYNEMTAVTSRPGQGCAPDSRSDIVVCGSSRSDQRLPLPEERDRTPVGPSPEPAGAEANCAAVSGGPCPVCPPTGCTGVNLLAVPFKLFRIVRAIVDPDR